MLSPAGKVYIIIEQQVRFLQGLTPAPTYVCFFWSKISPLWATMDGGIGLLRQILFLSAAQPTDQGEESVVLLLLVVVVGGEPFFKSP